MVFELFGRGVGRTPVAHPARRGGSGPGTTERRPTSPSSTVLPDHLAQSATALVHGQQEVAAAQNIVSRTSGEKPVPPQTEAIPANISPSVRYLVQRLLDQHKEWTKYADIPLPVREAMDRYTWAEEREAGGDLDASSIDILLSKLNEINDILASKVDVQNRIAALLKALRDNSTTLQIADRAALLCLLQTMLDNGDVLSFITRHSINDALYLERIFDRNGAIRRDYPRVDMSIISIAAAIKEYVSSKPADAKWGPGSGAMLTTFRDALTDRDKYRDFFKEFGI